MQALDNGQILLFLSTPSGWRATVVFEYHKVVEADFYPRPPGGGRPLDPSARKARRAFLSTPSGWRATDRLSAGSLELPISIHALRVEGD